MFKRNLYALFSVIFKDKNGRIVMGQKPNLQIILAILSYAGFKLFNSYEVAVLFYILFLGFLTWWSLLELLSGVNLFRRFLGLAGIMLVAGLFVKLVV